MKITKKATFLACLCCTFSFYSNMRRKAGERLQTARAVFEHDDYGGTKVQIDSAKVLCPKVSEVRREGTGFMQQVELKEQKKMLAYLDNMLREKQETVDAVKGNYVSEKDTKYQRIGDHLHPSQVTEENLHRSYLCFQVDESGVMGITSIYCGPHNIHHLAVKVTVSGGDFTETPAFKDSYEATDLGGKIEKAGYRVGGDGSVVTFLNLNKDKNIHVSYLGERPYATTITPNGRKAVATIYELAQLLSAIIEIRKDKDETDLEIGSVKRRMAGREGREKE